MAELFDDVTATSAADTVESIAALQISKSSRILQPARYGGAAGRAGEFVSTMCELAALDGSAGWLAGMLNAAAHEVAELPGSAADDVWGANPEALVAVAHHGKGVLAPSGLLTGQWASVVGAEYAEWLLLQADDGGDCRVLVPRSAARIEPATVQHCLGSAGVGDVTVAEVPVARRHVFDTDRGRSGLIAGAAAAIAVVGSADGVWRRHVEQVRVRLATSYGGDEASDEASAQVAWAASDIDAAKLQVMATLQTPHNLAAATWAYRQAVARARSAADRLLENSRHALNASDPVTRRWRDVHAGCLLAVRLLDGLASAS